MLDLGRMPVTDELAQLRVSFRDAERIGDDWEGVPVVARVTGRPRIVAG